MEKGEIGEKNRTSLCEKKWPGVEKIVERFKEKTDSQEGNVEVVSLGSWGKKNK